MLGLVLGTLRLPLIVLATGSPLTAAGTNIAVSAASAGAGGLKHAREGRVDWRIVAWTAPPSVVGAIAGALLAGPTAVSTTAPAATTARASIRRVLVTLIPSS